MEISYGIMCRREKTKKAAFNLPPFLWRAPSILAGLARKRIGGTVEHDAARFYIYFRPVAERGRVIRIENISNREPELLNARRGFPHGLARGGDLVPGNRLRPARK